MPFSQELKALRNLLTDAELILETTPPLPQNRSAACLEAVHAALAITNDLIAQAKVKSPAAALGHKGGSTTSRRHGPEHYRQMAAARKTRAGGRPIKPIE